MSELVLLCVKKETLWAAKKKKLVEMTIREFIALSYYIDWMGCVGVSYLSISINTRRQILSHSPSVPKK